MTQWLRKALAQALARFLSARWLLPSRFRMHIWLKHVETTFLRAMVAFTEAIPIEYPFYWSNFHWSHGDNGDPVLRGRLLCLHRGPILLHFLLLPCFQPSSPTATFSSFLRFFLLSHSSPSSRLWGKSCISSPSSSAPWFCWNNTLLILVVLYWWRQCRVNVLRPGQLFGGSLHFDDFTNSFPAIYTSFSVVLQDLVPMHIRIHAQDYGGVLYIISYHAFSFLAGTLILHRECPLRSSLQVKSTPSRTS